ncbi:hypothetical protein [Nocardia donostiensis]|nr:hypothetical protein [Nocardia donostiensis]
MRSPRCPLADFIIATEPVRYHQIGDLHAGIDDAFFDLSRRIE